jgi:cytochrome c553
MKQGSETVKLTARDTLATDSADVPLPDSVIYKRTDFTHEELIRGKRLFYGLAYLGDKSFSCVSCHNTTVSDTLNWNPDAYEISKKYFNKSAEDLSKVLLKPLGKKMQLVHTDWQLSAEDITLIKAFMNTVAIDGMKQPKPVITNLLLLIIASILFLISVTDLIIKKIYKYRIFNPIIITITGVFITWVLAVNAIAFGRSKGFSPDQPIKFSHAVHAGQNKTDCNYCHYTAKTGKSAGIPSVSICNNCHFLVRNGTRSGTAEITKIIESLDSNKTVDWVRMYKLPDYVFFSHAQHVTAGEIACETCHGDVKTVDRLVQVPDLSMGWCIDCHDTTSVNLANEYYKRYYPQQVRLFQEGKIDIVMIAGIGGRDCGKCHY